MRGVVAVLGVLVSAPLAAQGWLEPLPGRPRPAGLSVIKTRTQVEVTIRGRIAEVVVNEWFTNRGGPFGEADYHFPLPGEAVFGNYSLWQGDDELRGEMMQAQDARQIYEDIVRRRRDPALIEYAGRGLIRARVFPFAPGEERRVTLRYTQMLDAAGQALGFRYVAGRRDSVPVAITVTAPEGAQYLDPFSPTHQLDVRRDRGRLVVRPTERPTGEIAIFFPPAESTVGLTMVTHRPAGEREGWFMLTLTPGNAAQQAVPRDIAVVVDVSGSMSGGKMEQARGALHQLLSTLTPRDRFRLIAFSAQVRSPQQDWAVATPDAVQAARAWVDGLRADGGTNIAGALQEAFRVEPAARHLPIVLFLTDGMPTVGERNPEVIADHAESQHGRARVFAFGVGYDVNTYLLDRLSAAGRGRTEYVEPDEDIESSVGRLAGMISRPLLTDLALTLPDGMTDVYPRQLPDLFSGEELVIFGRYRESRGSQPIVLVGRAGGETRRFSVRANTGPVVEANDFVATLWAGRKLGELHRQARIEGATPTLIAAIREHALRYGLLSEYTAYLVQEPQFALNGGQQLMPMPASPGASASGMGAVQQAERDRGRREQRTLIEATAAEDAMATHLGPVGNGRTVAGRLFRQESGVWTDAAADDRLRLVHIAPFSPAYFAVLRALPELVPFAETFEAVTVAGARVRIRFGEGGREAVTDVDRLVADFRGR